MSGGRTFAEVLSGARSGLPLGPSALVSRDAAKTHPRLSPEPPVFSTRSVPTPQGPLTEGVPEVGRSRRPPTWSGSTRGLLPLGICTGQKQFTSRLVECVYVVYVCVCRVCGVCMVCMCVVCIWCVCGVCWGVWLCIHVCVWCVCVRVCGV